MASLQMFDLAKPLMDAEQINSARRTNRLASLLEPYKMREIQRNEQEAVAGQQDSAIKRNAAAARLALGVMGDMTNVAPEEAQQRFSTARLLVADMGVDVSKIPEQFSPDVYRGIQALASQYSGIDPTKYQFGGDIVTQDANGNPLVGTLRRDPQKGTVEFVAAAPGGALASKLGLTPQQQADLDAQTAGKKRAAELGVEVSMAPSVAGARAQVAGAEEKAKAEARNAADISATFIKKAQGANSVMASLDAAEELLNRATGSDLGAFFDRGAQVFGRSTEGAQAIAGLKIIQADLMLGMPRMEGPQSDRDVQLYREAAAQVGDPTVPAPTKRAAIRTIRQLQQKYATGKGQQAAGLDPETDQILKGLGL